MSRKRKETLQTLYVGINGEKVVNSVETKKQINRVKKLKSMLTNENGQPLDWYTFDNPEEPRTLFQAILKDRKMRVDKGQLMADRPSFAVITAKNGKAVRLEYYEGHDSLELVYDIRSPEFYNKELQPYMEKDEYAYDPSAFLEELFGIPKDISKPILEILHKMDE